MGTLSTYDLLRKAIHNKNPETRMTTEQLIQQIPELLTEYAMLEQEFSTLKEAVVKVVEMHRKGEGHVCTHYPNGRRALDALAALVGEGR